MEPEYVFRSHDWAVSTDGHLTPKPIHRQFRQVALDCIEKADAGIAEVCSFILSKLTAQTASALVTSSAPACSDHPKPERATLRRAERKPEPEPESIPCQPPLIPNNNGDAIPQAKQHDAICADVSRLVREGKSYSEAMDIALGDEPETKPAEPPKHKQGITHASAVLQVKAAELKNILPGDFQIADDETLLDAIRQLDALQADALQERWGRGKKALSLSRYAYYSSLERESEMREGCFHPYAIDAIIKGYDIRPLMEKRLQLIQSGKLRV